MKDSSKTKQVLTEELASLRQRIRELEQSEAERKKIEEALRESEGRLNALYRESPIPTFTWQKRGEDFFLVDFNSAAVRITDGKAHNFLDKRAEELYEYQPQVFDDMRRCFTEHSVIRRDILSKHFAPGKFLSVHYAFIPPDLIIVHTEDQTDHKQMAEKLQESEENYRLLIENANEAIFVAQDGKLVFHNPLTSRIIGYSSEELMGRSFIDFIHPDDRNMVAENYLKRLKGEDFQSRYAFRCVFKDGGIRWVEIGAVRIDWTGRPATLNFVTDITVRKRAEEQLQQSLLQLRRAVETTIQVLVMAVEIKDPYTAGHQRRMTNLSRAMATEMGLPPEMIEGLRMAGVIHDIGKITMPTEILSKPTKLSAIELSLIREHVRLGYDILKDVGSSWPLAEIVLQHHERMDGSGYPRNLKGDDILMEARILAVADVVEAMASYRPYRPALGIDAALEEIEKNRGTLYDKTVADACLKLFRAKGYQFEGSSL